MFDANPLTPPQTEDTVQTEIVPEVQRVSGEAVPEDESQTGMELQDSEPMTLGSEFDDELFGCSRERVRLTRKQKRSDRQQYAAKQKTHPLEVTIQQFEKLQNEDPTLDSVRKAVAGDNVTAAGTGFYRKNGLIYRKWTPPRQGVDMTVEQLVVPETCRRQILEVAHTFPLAGHLVRDKTVQRIQQRFYWPTIYQDTKDFCRRCEECQKARGHKVLRAPLIPLPIIGEPFRRIAMDIVGPLPRSRSGNKYVLVVCDYATRYPEAVYTAKVNRG